MASPSIRRHKWRPQKWEDAIFHVPEILTDFKPLAIGVHAALFAMRVDGVSKSSVRALISDHVRNERYLKNLKAGSIRFNIAYIPDGMVTKKDQEYAERELGKLDHQNG